MSAGIARVWDERADDKGRVARQREAIGLNPCARDEPERELIVREHGLRGDREREYQSRVRIAPPEQREREQRTARHDNRCGVVVRLAAVPNARDPIDW